MAGAAYENDFTVDSGELAKFATFGRDWWDATGPLAPLHKLNPVRVAYIRDQACRQLGRDPTRMRPLAGLKVLDIGCGGGLLAEPIARLGGEVTGIDPATENIEVARWHAEEASVDVSYQAVGIEALTATGGQFDLALASEVIEHVAHVPEFLAAAAAVIRPGGLIVLSTLSRTVSSFLKAIVGAEYLLRWLPRGTHDWRRFVTPAELGRALRAQGVRPIDVRGVAYDGAHDRFVLVRDPSVNYLMAAIRG
jgi:2-polyprenyl-6-hydroxyphenyl methylase/3-demethylubiquinone-9 3-methyltransferase